MSESRTTHGKKKAYRPPEVTRVVLKPEEAVLGFCKHSAAAGPLHAPCSMPTPCASQGS